jgi:hypothetical protein
MGETRRFPWRQDPETGQLVPPWELYSDYPLNVAQRPYPKV